MFVARYEGTSACVGYSAKLMKVILFISIYIFQYVYFNLALGPFYANLGHTQVFQNDQAYQRLEFNLDLSSTISCPLKSVELQQAQLPFFQDVVE